MPDFNRSFVMLRSRDATARNGNNDRNHPAHPMNLWHGPPGAPAARILATSLMIGMLIALAVIDIVIVVAIENLQNG